MSNFRKILTFRVNDNTPEDHKGRLGEITYRDGFLYFHDGNTPGGEIIGGGGSSGGPVSWSSITGKPTFAAVATSGSYADLSNKPTIPSLDGYATEEWVNSQGFGESVNLGNFTFSAGDASLPAGNTMTLTTFRSGSNEESKLTLSPTTESSLYVAGILKLGTGYGSGSEQYWQFAADGSLTLPLGGDILRNGVSVLGGGNANTGDVTFDGVKVIGAGTASGDGNGYATLELVPDNNLYGNDQYLVIDPTSPGHIHIRSGGAQDASNAQLFLGGENTHVRIIDGDNAIRMSHQQSSQLSSVTLTAGVDYSTAEWIDDGGNYSIVFNDVQQSTLDAIWGLSGSLNTFEIYDGVSYTTIAGYYGSSTPGVGQTASLSVGQAPATTPTTVVSVTLNSIGITASYVEVSGTDVRIEAQDDVRIFSRDTFLLANYSTSDPVVISTDYNGTDHRWEFRNDGVLEIPSNGDIIRGGVSVIPNLATVATSGSYNDLNDKPSLLYRQVAVPSTSKGAVGDSIGDIAFDGGYIYYCTAIYVDGIADIWKRVSWSGDTW